MLTVSLDSRVALSHVLTIPRLFDRYASGLAGFLQHDWIWSKQHIRRGLGM